jgi:hypothetical protein
VAYGALSGGKQAMCTGEVWDSTIGCNVPQRAVSRLGYLIVPVLSFFAGFSLSCSVLAEKRVFK